MTEPGRTLKSLLDALDESVHGLMAAPRGLGAVVRSVTIAHDGEPLPVGTLAVVPGEEASALADRISDTVAAVAVTGDPGEGAERLRALGLPVLSVDPRLTEKEFADLVRAVLETPGDEPRHRDLFSLAETVATLTGGLVSIEDSAGAVLAYSAAGEGADELRRRTILGRGCPESFLAHLRAWGVNERLAAGEVVEVAERPDLGAERRLVVGILAGDRMLGGIWVQIGGAQRPATAARVLLGAARLAAAHLMRAHGGARSVGGDPAELAVGLLTGAFDTDALARHLGADPATPVSVIALALGGDADGRPWLLERAAETASVYAASYRSDALVIPACGLLYLLMPAPSGNAAPGSWVRDLVTTLRHNLGTPVQAALAGVAPRMSGVPALKKVASRTLDVVRDRPELTVTAFEDVRSSVVLRELIDDLAERPHLRDVRLDDLDEEQYRSLAVYLATFGDVTRAAELLHVHPNTLRHRVRRIRTLTGLDLDDPDQRLLASLTLRARSRGGDPDSAGSPPGHG
ncbi:helix-turn-helix domain-containing protein [Nocardiopsis sp. N85]|uniref:PucR family transcriptional regulator n=1 Tax=Nocardiopsis sp. N85 TaxID=3029400 RepID=UPI00237FD528|nr:helix-turn-helix domain-containing protein [Nocardiopsis sp. N85]MDE3724865.1 helix-turn-helix domain-containing protein [Nocardiopsis sp. N85]